MYFPIVAIIGRYQDSNLSIPLKFLARILTKTGRKILLESNTASFTGIKKYPIANLEQIGKIASLAIVIGGDGTVLNAARYLAPYKVPLFGINHGRLGFITDISIQDIHTNIALILEGNYQVEERTLLKSSVWRGNQKLYSASALNDVVLNRSSKGGMIGIRVEFDNILMYNQRADGLIIATPTGSTAYALASNGPILHPNLNALVLVPVAPQTLSNRPVVISDTGVLSMILTEIGLSESHANVHFDTQTWSNLKIGDCITVQRAQHTIQFIHPPSYSFFSTLRKKLHWNIMPKFSNSNLDLYK